MITFAAFLVGIWIGAVIGVLAAGMSVAARDDDNARGIS